jgi:hypothetical protein
MGMRVGGSGYSNAAQSAGVSNWQQRQQGVKTMFSAIQSGDLAAAQKSYAALGNGSDGQSSSDSPFAAIGKALQSGDIGAAQQVVQDIQARRSGHSHRHEEGQSTSNALNPTSSASLPLAESGPGALVNLLA